jgi:uncharacterized protein YbcI
MGTISEEIAQIHADSYGGVANVESFVFEDLVVSLIDIDLLPSEEVVIEAGHPELVTTVRDEFEQSIRASFKAAVERTTGRSVIAFMSKTHIDPTLTLELFVLGEQPE